MSRSFPSNITFWVDIIGIPLHHLNDNTVSTIGKELGYLVEWDVEKARVRVCINGLVSLVMSLEIRLPSDEITEVEFVYEKLEKHCFSCFSLSHEKKHSPSSTVQSQGHSKPLGMNQIQTLTRIEEDKLRQVNKKRPRDYFKGNATQNQAAKRERVSTKDLRDWLDKHSPSQRYSSNQQGTLRRTPPASPTKDESRGVFSRILEPTSGPKDRPVLDKGKWIAYSHLSPHDKNLREEFRTPAQRGISHSHSKSLSQVQPALRSFPPEVNSQSNHSSSRRSRHSPTPPPRPHREPVCSPPAQTPQRSLHSSGERRPALERIVLPQEHESPGSPNHIDDPMSLQDVQIRVVETHPQVPRVGTSQSPALGSVFQRLGITTDATSPLSDSVFLRLGSTTAGPSAPQAVKPASSKKQRPTKAKQETY